MEAGVRPRIVVIGSGNVASHLAPALDRHVGDVVQVMSRDLSHARRLAGALRGAVAVDRLEDVVSDADLYVMSVSDDSIVPLLDCLDCRQGLWVHTSGSVPMTVFEGRALRYGVLYPLQTFSRDVAVDMRRVPFFVEGSDDVEALAIHDIAARISSSVHYADSLVRRQLHVAAVFACNFTCQMWAEADEILQRAGLPFSTLLPLIEATFDKVRQVCPADALTGPARRGDRNVIAAHMEMLPLPQCEIYRCISERIIDRYHDEHGI